MSRSVPVTVLLEMRSSGVQRPLKIIKDDGTHYDVTASRYVGHRAAKSSGSGECWLCRIEGQIIPLYYSTFSGRWWMDG
ncbi:MAG: hypothetical protein ACOX36_01440 [Saccharofermentanales bacterium]|jgi:hypothetical protein|nr:hypothetical protein [Clostridiaceae bacterium]